MLWDTAHQWQVFVYMAAAGALAGVCYDLLRLMRIRLEAGFWLSLAADLLFGAAAAALFIAFALKACFGQMRLYEMAAFALGGAAYMGGPHILLARAAGGVARLFSGLLRQKWVQKIFQ